MTGNDQHRPMLTVVDSGVGNIGSVLNMLKKIGVPAQATGEAAQVAAAEKIILPGVGSFDNGMRRLNELGLAEVICARAAAGVPLLGICLGMQLLTRGSEEGQLPGLGLLDAVCVRFALPPGAPEKVPHMGWNTVAVKGRQPLFDGFAAEARFYFVHSYHVRCHDAADVAATATHGLEFTAAVARGAVHGVQFHPEKSHNFGMHLLRNFAGLG